MAEKTKVEKWLENINDGKIFDVKGSTLADQQAADFRRMEKILAFKPEDLIENLTKIDTLSTIKASDADVQKMNKILAENAMMKRSHFVLNPMAKEFRPAADRRPIPETAPAMPTKIRPVSKSGARPVSDSGISTASSQATIMRPTSITNGEHFLVIF